MLLLAARKTCWCPAAGLSWGALTNTASVPPAQVAGVAGPGAAAGEEQQGRGPGMPCTGTADLLGGSAEHYLFRCNNTNLCGLLRGDKTKRIPKNAFPA